MTKDIKFSEAGELTQRTLEEEFDIGEIAEQFKGHGFERLLAPGAIDAVVLIPLVVRDGVTCVLFELRSSRIEQGGEVCFPGGRVEPGETLEETAIRETEEELQLGRDQIRLIAPLFKMMGPGGSEVSAFLGEIRDYKDTWSPSEVQEAFLIPLEVLLKMQPVTHESRYELDPGEGFPYELIQNGRQYHWHKIRKTYYFYKTRPEIIWGMTAELLYHFLEEMRHREQEKQQEL